MTRGRNYFRSNPATPNSAGCSAVILASTWDITVNSAEWTFSNGNRDATQLNGAGFEICLGAQAHSVSGKWYFEITPIVLSTGSVILGVAKSNVNLHSYVGADANGWSYYDLNGNKSNNGASAAYGAAFVQGNVIGVKVDFDTPELRFTKNGVDQGVAFTNIAAAVLLPAASSISGGDKFRLSTSLAQFAFFPGGAFSAWG